MPEVQVKAGPQGVCAIFRQDCSQELVFEKLREALESALDAATRTDGGQRVRGMHQAVIEAKTSLRLMEEGVEKTERLLVGEQKQLQDAERRGKLARDIGDGETAEIADGYATKHRERASVLERKLKAQLEELALAHREVSEMMEQLKNARANLSGVTAAGVDAAWREMESAVGPGTAPDPSEDVLRHQIDRAEREVAAQAKLEELKKKMGR